MSYHVASFYFYTHIYTKEKTHRQYLHTEIETVHAITAYILYPMSYRLSCILFFRMTAYRLEKGLCSNTINNNTRKKKQYPLEKTCKGSGCNITSRYQYMNKESNNNENNNNIINKIRIPQPLQPMTLKEYTQSSETEAESKLQSSKVEAESKSQSYS